MIHNQYAPTYRFEILLITPLTSTVKIPEPLTQYEAIPEASVAFALKEYESPSYKVISLGSWIHVGAVVSTTVIVITAVALLLDASVALISK